ncbi:MAG TPA: HAD-IC family P-type ATPase, partial [Gammaproteobacteria bacterium]|nr:HAD-IC family P-type ATPase [Gammaproteobacteria bacterium]
INKIDQRKVAISDEQWGFAGTILLTGNALVRVMYTGQQSLYGEIITSVVITQHQQTPLQKAVAQLILKLIIAASILSAILAISRYAQGFGIIDALFSAAIFAVGALPDEFPVVFTFFLGLGVYRLAKNKALVRRAVSIENIGRVTTICSDKTGTITEGKLQLLHIFPDKELSEKDVIKQAALASRVQSGDPLDLAIYATINDLNLTLPDVKSTFPFTEERLRETGVILEKNREYLFSTKGSPEKILEISSLSADKKQYWHQKILEYSSQGYKTIAVASQIQKSATADIEPVDNYHFSGLLVFSDPVRKEVRNAVLRCLKSGIHVLMITGDHPETARMIAKEIGLGNGNPKVILASEAQKHSKETKENYYKSIDVIARAIPSEKQYIVKSLQDFGEIVAVTGDGVNDIPALKVADIGIAMGQSGSQSAREAAKIILLDNNFNSIVNAISEGQQLFKNLKLSFKYLIMIHIPFVFSAALIPLLGYPLLYRPINIVFIELIIHPTCMLVFQNFPDVEKLNRAMTNAKIGFFQKLDWLSISVVGILTTAVIIIGYTMILNTTNNVEHARAFSMASLGIMSAAITASLSNLRTKISITIVGFTLLCTIASIQLTSLAKIFEVTPLHFLDWVSVLIIGVITVILSKEPGCQPSLA